MKVFDDNYLKKIVKKFPFFGTRFCSTRWYQIVPISQLLKQMVKHFEIHLFIFFYSNEVFEGKNYIAKA